MFDFFKKNKKVINTLDVKEFNSAIKAIKVFIAIYDWENGKNAIEEIRKKEKDAYEMIIPKIKEDNAIKNKEEIIKKEEIEFNKKMKYINSIENKLLNLENKYIEKTKNERFKIRFNKIKEEIGYLTGTKNYQQAMSLLKTFLEENKENNQVINFFNREKKKLQLNIEKQRKKEKEKIQFDAKYEALDLIGETVLEIEPKEEKSKEKSYKLINSILKKINFYKSLKEKLKRKKLLDEINLLIEEDNRVKNEIAEKKLENIHKGLIKEINKNDLIGYELYGKILGADKISGDTFGIEENKSSYKFFIGDATGNGIRAGFIITLISKLFKDNSGKDLKEMVLNINNGLKQDLQSRNFVTGIFFDIEKLTNKLSYVGMGHEPILIYKKALNKVEKIIVGGLASGIRIIKDKEDIKVKNIDLEDQDILLIYSDGLIESKSIDGTPYGIDRLKDTFENIVQNEDDVKKIYEHIINDIKIFKGGTNFDDDITTIIFKRNTKKDVVNENDIYIEELKLKEKLNRTEVKNLKGKNKEEIEKEIEHIRRKKEIKSIVKNLEILYYTGEILKVKEEATRYIKAGYIDEKINSYLRKVINNEKRFKIDQKNQKMQLKYSILEELYKKGDYDVIINEIEEIIAKDGNI